MALALKLRKTATSQDCKYDVLRGGRKHSTTCGKAGFMAARVKNRIVELFHALGGLLVAQAHRLFNEAL